jgi:hypothetical protein
MRKKLVVLQLGDTEIDVEEGSLSEPELRIPLVLQDGEELELAFEGSALRELWQFLSLCRERWPELFLAQ